MDVVEIAGEVGGRESPIDVYECYCAVECRDYVIDYVVEKREATTCYREFAAVF